MSNVWQYRVSGKKRNWIHINKNPHKLSKILEIISRTKNCHIYAYYHHQTVSATNPIGKKLPEREETSRTGRKFPNGKLTWHPNGKIFPFPRFRTHGMTSRSGLELPVWEVKTIFSQLKKISKVKFIFFSVKNLKIWCFITSKKFQLSPAIVQLRRRFSHFSTSRRGRNFPNGKKKFEQILPVREVSSRLGSFFPIGLVAETV